MDLAPLLSALVRRRCRFVVVGSVARELLGELVSPADLDVVIDSAASQQAAIIEAMIELMPDSSRVIASGRCRRRRCCRGSGRGRS